MPSLVKIFFCGKGTFEKRRFLYYSFLCYTVSFYVAKFSYKLIPGGHSLLFIWPNLLAWWPGDASASEAGQNKSSFTKSIVDPWQVWWPGRRWRPGKKSSLVIIIKTSLETRVRTSILLQFNLYSVLLYQAETIYIFLLNQLELILSDCAPCTVNSLSKMDTIGTNPSCHREMSGL